MCTLLELAIVIKMRWDFYEGVKRLFEHFVEWFVVVISFQCVRRGIAIVNYFPPKYFLHPGYWGS